HIKDVEARRYTLLRFAVHHDCSFAFTGNPSSLLALFELADRQADSLIKDIHDGTLDSRFDVPEPIRMVALNDLLPDPGRARALARARERAGRLMPADYWPDLKVLGCWIGGSMGHFAPLLRQWCGERFRFRDVGYMASEGVFTVPFANDAADGLMALDSIFFEFLPEQDFGRRDITPLLAHEIEPGRNYHVIITTTGGLYRYAMNDVVRAGSSEWGVPTLRFLYKGNHVQNLQGEMVTVDHVMSAMSSLCEGHGIRLHHFQIVADLDRRRYLLHVEPIDRLARPLLTRLLLDFDGELGKANENYAMFRADGLIGAPSLRVMRQGWFDRILQDHVARSGRDSQFKPAVLASAAEHGEMAELSIDWPPDGLREHVFPQRLASRRQ
ncbi:MAG TPA: GH3 auxin-responsive promoter family protein, partial [Dongiaceae bacterium]|nr:GH3 auxin-responsive promoter family protein [Dongiaceae bacterium]